MIYNDILFLNLNREREKEREQQKKLLDEQIQSLLELNTSRILRHFVYLID